MSQPLQEYMRKKKMHIQIKLKHNKFEREKDCWLFMYDSYSYCHSLPSLQQLDTDDYTHNKWG